MIKTGRVALLLTTILFIPTASHAAFISFSSSVQQLGTGPTTYAFIFGAPIPVALYTEATSIGEVTLTPGLGGEASIDVSAVYPTFISGYGALNFVSTNLGVDLGTTPCTATGGVAVTCPFSLVTSTFAPTLYDGIEALLNFQVTGVGAIAAWTGTVTLTQTTSTAPEPGTVLLFAAAMVAAVRAHRRR